jgi:3-hydroxyacyl-CoA dehydrogenase
MITAKHRKLRKVAVLGSGIMGSRIACHLANAGLEVILLDIVTPNLSEEDLTNPTKRNTLVNGALKAAVKSNPSPIYSKSFVNRIQTGNLDDNLADVATCDWIIEAIIERLDIKIGLFEKLEHFRKPGTLVSSNTSGIPIHMMLDGRSDDFKEHFLGTHFFNPPRYLPLLEIIPTNETHVEVVDFFMDYGDLFLGKMTVLCKDTPAFIANRIGVFSIMTIFNLMQEMGLTIEEVDAVTGPVSGRPKSATFRTCDLVGLDTLVKVAQGVQQNCPEDEASGSYTIPDFLAKMVENKWLGDKTKQGFYKKSKDASGKRVIEALYLKKMEYLPKAKVRSDAIGLARGADSLSKKIHILFNNDDKLALFYKRLNLHLFSYVSNRIPEISDNLYGIDDALKAGFGWELGPFETWDVVGVEKAVELTKAAGLTVADWVGEMLSKGISSFYKTEGGKRFYYDPKSGAYQLIPGLEGFVLLDNFRTSQKVYGNKECTLHDIGDGVLCLEFHTKMNAIGSGILSGINKSIELAEKGKWKGLVIGNDAQNFSAGANLAMMLMLAIEQEYEELDMAIRYFQKTVMRLRYSSVPVVMAPHGLTLGGGCEMSLHADSTVAAAETYIGLVEFGAGLIPGGGGTKEFVVRASDSFYEGDPQLPTLQNRFTTIATAKVATSAYEAFEIGVLHDDKDHVVINGGRLLASAKQKVIELYNEGYTQPIQRSDIMALGQTALGTLYSGVEAFMVGHYASEHDRKIARKLSYVMAGGDLSQPTLVSEQYLLDLERQAFLSLLGERKTLERIQHILKTGKPLRN